MSAFQPYSGVYEVNGRLIRWRCYATAPLHAVCRDEVADRPPAPAGAKWIAPRDPSHKEQIAVLVDASVDEVSQILLQIDERSA